VVPPAVVTLTFLVPSCAVAATVKVAVTVVVFTTDMLLTVMPVPLKFTVCVLAKLVPVKVTVIARPRMRVLGETEISVGRAKVP
jgi:hypothetical protein